jgi:hypothetical protein
MYNHLIHDKREKFEIAVAVIPFIIHDISIKMQGNNK